MAYEIPGKTISLEASGDLSAAQHHMVEVDANGQLTVSNSAGESVFGVLQNDPNAQGRVGTVMKDGVSKCVAGAAVVAGNLIQTNASGRGIPVASGDFVVGRALDAAANDGETFTLAMGENHRTA
jgi:hypothetical protein